MSKEKIIDKLRDLANALEELGSELEDNGEDSSVYDDAVSYIRLAIDELRND